MTQTNGERIRAGFQAYDERGLDAVAAPFAPDAEWFAEESGPWDCHSRQDIMATYQRHLDEGAQGEVAEVVEAGDQVVLGLRVHHPAHDHGEHVHGEHDHVGHDHGEAFTYHVLTMRDNQIVRMQDHPDRASALHAIGTE